MASGQGPIRTLDRLLPLAVFVTTLSVLVFEVSLTRAFSVLLRFHFVFLAVSLAICGLGLGGLLDYLLRRRAVGWAEAKGTLALPLLLLGLFYPLTVVLLFATPLSAHLTSLWVLSAVCLPPFICAGVFVSHIFARHSAASGYLYFADLTGAALGSIGVIALLQLVGAVNAALVCGMLAAGGAMVVMVWARSRLGLAGGLILLVGLSVLLQQNLARRVVDLPYLPPQAGHLAKPLYQELGDKRHPAEVVYSAWNAFARTDVVRFARPDGRFYPDDDLLMYTDGEVPTNMLHFTGNLQQFAEEYSTFLGMYAFRAFRPRRVMLIGPGGGLDILLALAVGTKEIEGAEINPSIPRIVRDFGDFCGPVYDYQNVNIQVAEGRSYLSRSPGNYDLIYMALTKTATTTSNSMALVESYAHTTEAFEEYYRRLSEDGALAFICQYPSVLLRAFTTAWLAVQQEAGVDPQRAAQHLMVLDQGGGGRRVGPYRHLLLMTRQPLNPERAEQLAKEAIAWGQEPVFFPGAFEQFPFSRVTKQPLTIQQFVELVNRSQGRRPGQGLNFAPCPDDRPFVVDMVFGVPRQFWAFAGTALGLVIVLSLAAWPGLRSSQLRGGGTFAAQVVYFSLLGIGFMLVEISLIQKLILYLGYPVLSLSVILFALLLGGGLGSLYSQRWPRASLPRCLVRAGAMILSWGLMLYFLSPTLMQATLYLSIQLRSLLTMAMLFPLAWGLGMFFPSGLRLLSATSRAAVPWMWGINGLTSVAGSVLAMILAKFWGFSTVLLLGLGLYAAVMVLLAGGWAFPFLAGPEGTTVSQEEGI